jgi:tetratricopeptide (TPR) repeat protein
MESELHVTGDRLSLQSVQKLYDQHRFLDAYRATAEFWTPDTNVDQLSIEELVFAARLARQLGGERLSRRLFWKARERDPDKPLVRYFTLHLRHPGRLLLDDLAAFEQNRELGGNDDELRASWLATHAYTWASLRNYRLAKELLCQAHSIFPDSSWITSLEADVLGLSDDWSGSLLAAARARDLDSRSPKALSSLAAALMNLGRIGETLHPLATAAAYSQSPILVQAACWFHCAVAEVSDGEERRRLLRKADELANQTEARALLADRSFKIGLARNRLDIAKLGDDHAEMERWAAEARSPFHRRMLANLKRNPDGKRVLLPFRRRIQKHSECVPTSIGSALSATGVEISVETLAAEVTFGGTPSWAGADWLRNQGFHTRFFSANLEIATALIEAGIGFMVTWEDDQSGHAVAIVGIDHSAGILIAHDPTSFRCTECLFERFQYHQGPLGILGMAAVPKEREHQLDDLLPPDAEIVEIAQAHQKADSLLRIDECRKLVERVTEKFPLNPGTRYLRAVQELKEGRIGQARHIFHQLLNEYPNSPAVRVNFMAACRAIGNTALVRSTLQAIVETCAIPGVESENNWIRPHPRYVWEYADLLGTSSTTRTSALKLLRQLLKISSTMAGAWHVLADLQSMERQSNALLAYAIASYLEPHNEYYVRAYFNALCRADREPEGLEWLEQRIRDLGRSSQGVTTWITYVRALEDCGLPERAVNACHSALQNYPDSSPLIAFAVPFLGRMGKWTEAELQLQNLAKLDLEGSFHPVAAGYYRMRGERRAALEHVEKWVHDFPRSMPARHALLELTAALKGGEAAVTQAAAWLKQYPAHEDFEEAFCSLPRDGHRWRVVLVLRARVARNREDGWAWRELAFIYISIFQMSDEAHRKRHQPRILSYLSEAKRVALDDSPTLRLEGLWKEAQGDWQGAVDCYLGSIRRDPSNFFSYGRAWEISSGFSETERRELWKIIEPIYLQTPGNLPHALEMVRLLAERFGVRETEKIVSEWRTLRPDDPNVIEAAADLLLHHGHGRSDTARALVVLRVGVERFPYHSGLRLSLATAYRMLGDLVKARDVFQELARRHPDDVNVTIQLAWIHQHHSQTDSALSLLSSCCEHEPYNYAPVFARARILINSGRFEDARRIAAECLDSFPLGAPVYEGAIALFSDCGDPQNAVDTARRGTKDFPRGAYLWLLRGKTLRQFPQFAAPGEIEMCFRRSLRLNCGLFEAVDGLVILLSEQERYLDATRILEAIAPGMPDPSPALGRLAWIKRNSGDKVAALQELTGLLRKRPWYAWGWKQLVTWLKEDQDWSRAKDIMQSVPPQMMADVAFRERRLRLLQKARISESVLDSEWDSLLDEFPEEPSIHQRRYDFLAERKRWDEASAVLNKIAPVSANDPFLLARLIELDCRNGKRPEALEHALRISFVAVEQSSWPVNQAWNHLRKVGWADQFADRFWERLKNGEKPTVGALTAYADYLLLADDMPPWLNSIRHTWLNHSARRVLRLIKMLQQSGWPDHTHMAALFARLNHHRYGRLVLSSWKRMNAMHLENDTAAWAQISQAMVTLGHKRAGRRLMHDWRTRVGVPMSTVANYLLCIGRIRMSDIDEVALTCRDALRDLPHDHCAGFIAYMGAEANALASDLPALVETWNRHTPYFERLLKEGEFFPPFLKYLHGDLPVLVRASRTNDLQACRRIIRGLRWRRLWDQHFRGALRKAGRYYALLILLVWIAFLVGGMIAALFAK